MVAAAREAVALAAVALVKRREAAAAMPDPRRYLRDPLAWIDAFVDFGEDGGLTAYQRDIIGALVEHGRECARGPHGLGKTTCEALIVIWFAWTRDAAGLDWKAVTTASAWRQLTKYLWPEIHKWVKRVRWDRLGAPQWRDGVELLDLALKLAHGEAFAVASDNPALIEGAHADSLLYVFDESKAVPPATFDAAEGAFAGAGSDTAAEAFALACSTPGEPAGRFYDIQSRRPGTEDWHVRAVTREECVAAGRMSRQWADARRRQWGETSAVYLNRVEGAFASSSEDGLIPLSWVEAAVERWREWDDAGRPMVGGAVLLGCDVGRTADKTVIVERTGRVVAALHEYGAGNTMQTAGRVKARLDAGAARAVVDVVGIGAGVVDRLEEEGHAHRVVAFNGGEKCERADRSGKLFFANKRAASWWALRDMLDPTDGDAIALPPDDELIGDLTAVKWRQTSGGKVLVEDKDDIKARLGRSPDKGDAVVMAFWEPDAAPAGGVHFGAVKGWGF